MAGPWEKYAKQPPPAASQTAPTQAPAAPAPEAGPWDRYRAAKPQPVGMGEDVARALPAGLKAGTEELIGAPQDTANAGGAVVGKIARWLGFQPETADAASGVTANAIGGALNPIGGVSRMLKDAGGPDLTRLYAPTTSSVKQDAETAVPLLKSANYDPQTRLGKFAKTGAEFVPGAVAGEARLGSILRRVAEQFGIGLASEAGGQLTEGSAYEPWARAGAGLAGAMLLGPMLRKGPVTPQAQRTMDEGIDLTAGQATGNRGLRNFESEIGGSATQAIGEEQRQQLTSRAMREIGAPAGSLATPETMAREGQRIGGEFERVAAAVGDVPIGVPQQQGMIDAVQRYNSLTGSAGRAPIVGDTVSNIGELMRGNGGPVLNGPQIANLRTNLGEAIRSADGTTMEALRGIQDQLDNAVAGHLAQTNPQLAQDWSNARRQYRLYLDLERAVANEPASVAGQGVVTPAALRGGVKGVEGNRRLVTGQSEFAGLANDAAVAMSPLPDSGTAGRTAARAVPALLAGGTVAGHPGAALAAVLAPAGVGRVVMSPPVQRLLMSAPENARAALTALIAAHQMQKGQEARR